MREMIPNRLGRKSRSTGSGIGNPCGPHTAPDRKDHVWELARALAIPRTRPITAKAQRKAAPFIVADMVESVRRTIGSDPYCLSLDESSSDRLDKGTAVLAINIRSLRMDQPETIASPMQGTPFNGMDIARELLRVFTLVPPDQCVAIISDNCVVPKNAIRFVTAHMPARGLRSLSKTQRTLLRACQSAGINQLTCGMHTLNLFVEQIFKAFPRALVCIQRVHAAYNGEHSIKHRKALVRDLSLNPNLLRICKVRWTSRTEVIQYVCTHREALIQHLVEKVRTSTATKAAEVLCDARYCIELNAARLMTEHLCKLIARMQGSDALTGDIAALLDVAVRNDATSHAFHRLIADSMDRADDIDTQVTEPSARGEKTLLHTTI